MNERELIPIDQINTLKDAPNLVKRLKKAHGENIYGKIFSIESKNPRDFNKEKKVKLFVDGKEIGVYLKQISLYGIEQKYNAKECEEFIPSHSW